MLFRSRASAAATVASCLVAAGLDSPEAAVSLSKEEVRAALEPQPHLASLTGAISDPKPIQASDAQHCVVLTNGKQSALMVATHGTCGQLALYLITVVSRRLYTEKIKRGI